MDITPSPLSARLPDAAALRRAALGNVVEALATTELETAPPPTAAPPQTSDAVTLRDQGAAVALATAMRAPPAGPRSLPLPLPETAPAPTPAPTTAPLPRADTPPAKPPLDRREPAAPIPQPLRFAADAARASLAAGRPLPALALLDSAWPLQQAPAEMQALRAQGLLDVGRETESAEVAARGIAQNPESSALRWMGAQAAARLEAPQHAAALLLPLLRQVSIGSTVAPATSAAGAEGVDGAPPPAREEVGVPAKARAALRGLAEAVVALAVPTAPAPAAASAEAMVLDVPVANESMGADAPPASVMSDGAVDLPKAPPAGEVTGTVASAPRAGVSPALPGAPVVPAESDADASAVSVVEVEWLAAEEHDAAPRSADIRASARREAVSQRVPESRGAAAEAMPRRADGVPVADAASGSAVRADGTPVGDATSGTAAGADETPLADAAPGTAAAVDGPNSNRTAVRPGEPSAVHRRAVSLPAEQPLVPAAPAVAADAPADARPVMAAGASTPAPVAAAATEPGSASAGGASTPVPVAPSDASATAPAAEEPPARLTMFEVRRSAVLAALEAALPATDRRQLQRGSAVELVERWLAGPPPPPMSAMPTASPPSIVPTGDGPIDTLVTEASPLPDDVDFTVESLHQPRTAAPVETRSYAETTLQLGSGESSRTGDAASRGEASRTTRSEADGAMPDARTRPADVPVTVPPSDPATLFAWLTVDARVQPAGLLAGQWRQAGEQAVLQQAGSAAAAFRTPLPASWQGVMQLAMAGSAMVLVLVGRNTTAAIVGMAAVWWWLRARAPAR